MTRLASITIGSANASYAVLNVIHFAAQHDPFSLMCAAMFFGSASFMFYREFEA